MKYQVEVCRTAYGFHTFEVEAASQREAERIALDCAGNESYSEKYAEYSVDTGQTRELAGEWRE